MDDHTWLINIPTFKNIFFGISNLAVSKQTRVPPESYIKDYAPPPSGYDLWSAEIGSTVNFGKQHLDVSITANNITNVAYRDYLDRFRYFVLDPGELLY